MQIDQFMDKPMTSSDFVVLINFTMTFNSKKESFKTKIDFKSIENTGLIIQSEIMKKICMEFGISVEYATDPTVVLQRVAHNASSSKMSYKIANVDIENLDLALSKIEQEDTTTKDEAAKK
jgi:hypothetical protein